MNRYNRRRFLQQMGLGAGSLLLAPIVSKLLAEDNGFASSLPRRVVFVMEGAGFFEGCTRPVGLRRDGLRTRLINEPLAAYDLPSLLEPVAQYRDRITIIEGLSNRSTDTGHAANYGALGCYRANSAPSHVGTPKGPTIDYELGRNLPAIFPQLLLGVVDGPTHTAVYNCSAMGRDKPLPTICKPDFAYLQLFGSVAEGDAKKAFLAQRNLLDFMIDDIKAAKNLVGSAAVKFDPYLESYEYLRKRQSRLNEITDTLRKHAPVASDKYLSDDEIDRLDAHFDLAAAALIGGLTNVVTITAACGYPWFNVIYRGLGIENNRHIIGHGLGCGGYDAQTLQTIIRRCQMTMIARLMKKLEAVPEGNGTMLDNTLIVYMNEAGETHHATCMEWPLIVFGNLGGRLKLGGRYLCYPEYGAPGHRTVANFYMSLLEAVGDHRETFGHTDGELSHLDLRGPLTELLV